MHGIVQLFGAKKSVKSKNPTSISSLPFAANFFSKTIKYIEERKVFQETFKDVPLIVINPMYIYEYFMRKIIRIDDFRLIIFQDLFLYNDKHH